MKWIVLIILLLKSGVFLGQKKELDTASVKFHAKMLILADSYRLTPRDRTDVENYMSSTTDMGFEFLESSGFKEHVFIRMICRLPIWDSTVIKRWPVKEPVEGAWFLELDRFGTEFILAYNTRTSESFRLKGFYTIDLREFIYDLKEGAQSRKEYFAIKKMRLKYFEKKFFVDSLDWATLFSNNCSSKK